MQATPAAEIQSSYESDGDSDLPAEKSERLRDRTSKPAVDESHIREAPPVAHSDEAKAGNRSAVDAAAIIRATKV